MPKDFEDKLNERVERAMNAFRSGFQEELTSAQHQHAAQMAIAAQVNDQLRAEVRASQTSLHSESVAMANFKASADSAHNTLMQNFVELRESLRQEESTSRDSVVSAVRQAESVAERRHAEA